MADINSVPKDLGQLIGNNGTVGKAFGTLSGLLRDRGKLDPRLKIRKQEGIARRGQSRQQGIRQGAASAGLQNAGLFDAIDASVQAGTQRDIVKEDIDFAAAEEQKSRDDLSSLLDLVINPGLQLSEINVALKQQKDLKDQEDADRRHARDMEKVNTAISIAAIFCWVAREVYGEEDKRWRKVRNYMMNYADDDLRRSYAVEGQELAEEVKTNPELKAKLKLVFDGLIEEVEDHNRGLRRPGWGGRQ